MQENNGSLPRARRDSLLEETVGEELLLYDRRSHTAHCLSPIAASVWRHCDGARDVSELAVLAGASESLVADALHELREKYLLDAKPELMQSTVPGESRREAIGRVARYSAAVAAGSMIVSATAATPAMASSEGAFSFITEAGSNYRCTKKLDAENCCLCDKACGFGTGPQSLCETECRPYDGFVSFTKEASCEVI